jgi:hypothetical protein
VALVPLELLDAEISADYDPIDILRDLDHALEGRQAGLERYSRYYEGGQSLVFASDKWRRAFGGLFTEFRDNWCRLVVDAVEERLNVTGFRFGDEAGDTDAWHIWQANGLDADSQLAHTESLINGVSYAFVWYGEDDEPEISIEAPEQMIVAYEPGNRRRRRAALKKWLADDDTVFATLYMGDALWKFQGRAPSSGTPVVAGWEPREEPNEPWPLPNPLGVVPIIPIVNRPRLLPRHTTEGDSEITDVIPLQDAVNKILLDMLVASEFGAFRQRWTTGLDIPTDPDTNLPIEPFKPAVDRLWISENPETKFGEFGQTDLLPYTRAAELFVQHIASQTRTPPHYFYLSGQFPSGESIKSAETGLVAKARRKMRHFGESWEAVMKLAFRIQGDDRAQFIGAETIWGDPESRTEGQHVDALLKLKTLGVPEPQLWEDAGFSPQQIARFASMRAEQAYYDALANPAGIQFGPPTREQRGQPPNGAPAA